MEVDAVEVGHALWEAVGHAEMVGDPEGQLEDVRVKTKLVVPLPEMEIEAEAHTVAVAASGEEEGKLRVVEGLFEGVVVGEIDKVGEREELVEAVVQPVPEFNSGEVEGLRVEEMH